jgi:hypothetical protein
MPYLMLIFGVKWFGAEILWAYANEEEGMVSQNTTVIFGGAFYLG